MDNDSEKRRKKKVRALRLEGLPSNRIMAASDGQIVTPPAPRTATWIYTEVRPLTPGQRGLVSCDRRPAREAYT